MTVQDQSFSSTGGLCSPPFINEFGHDQGVWEAGRWLDALPAGIRQVADAYDRHAGKGEWAGGDMWEPGVTASLGHLSSIFRNLMKWGRAREAMTELFGLVVRRVTAASEGRGDDPDAASRMDQLVRFGPSSLDSPTQAQERAARIAVGGPLHAARQIVEDRVVTQKGMWGNPPREVWRNGQPVT